MRELITFSFTWDSTVTKNTDGKDYNADILEKRHQNKHPNLHSSRKM